MNITRRPLTWYADRILRGETFSLARYGDGELYCMLGREGKTCDGCDYRPDLAEALRRSLCRRDADFFHGLQRIFPHDAEEFSRLLGRLGCDGGNWLDSGVLGQAVIEGKLYPLIWALAHVDIVLVGNPDLCGVDTFLSYDCLIETPRSNAWMEKDRISREVLDHGKPACYLFSCGMTACALVDELHGSIPGSWFIDFGHVWDALIGKNTRYYMASLSHETVRRNLYGW